ncbi:MAG: nitroreductase family protein [Firmicutes bacterium]|nr:nitroreductase family protein [Bacillota bacterium]
MTLLEIMKHRRSVRKYTGEKIDEDKLQQILAAALLAPSGRAARPWEFVVVKDREMLDRLSISREHGAEMLAGADCAVVVFGDENKTDVWTEDCCNAMAHMYLMASALGVGCCWIQGRLRKTADGAMTEDYIRGLLDVPSHYRLEAIMSLGIPAEQPQPYELDQLPWEKIHKETF